MRMRTLSTKVERHEPATQQRQERKPGEVRAACMIAGTCVRKTVVLENDGTRDGQDEGNPHEKIKATKDVVEGFLPIDGRWRTNYIFAISLLTTNSGDLETNCGMTRIPGIDFIYVE